jgi:hypothetical protein
LETLAQDLWAGRIDLELEVDRVPEGTPVIDDNEDDDNQTTPPQMTGHNTRVREDTPIPDWNEEDNKSSPQADEQQTNEQTATSREGTPVPGLPDLPPPQPPQLDTVRPSFSSVPEDDDFPVWDGPTRCPYRCRAIIDTWESYLEHMRSHKGKSYACKSPGYRGVYVHLRSLRSHQRRIHGKPEDGVCINWIGSDSISIPI